MSLKSILVVEDDKAIRDMLQFVLTQNQFRIWEAVDAEAAELSIRENRPDLILLDWMLPGRSGVEFARNLRKDPVAREIPIILITARGEESDKVLGLNCGADDYITKPFSPRELVARIKAVLRRGAHGDDQTYLEVSGLMVDRGRHEVRANGSKVEIGPTEFKLLHFLMKNGERTYGRDQLLDRVWGSDAFVEQRTVDVCVRRLRKALEPHGVDHLIETIRGVGYRFKSTIS